MKSQSGFSLVEVVVAIVLLGLIAIGFAQLTYRTTDRVFYQRNVATQLAERKIEECRQRASTPITVGGVTNTGFQELGASSINPTSSWTSFSTDTGANQVSILNLDGSTTTTYHIDVTVVGYDIGTVSNGGTYSLTPGSSLLGNPQNSAPAYDKSQIKQVTIRVWTTDRNNPLVRRVIYIPRIGT